MPPVCGRGGQWGWKTCSRSFSSQSLAKMEPALGGDRAAEQELQHVCLSITAAGGLQGLALVREGHGMMCLAQLACPRRAGRRGLTRSPRSSALAGDVATALQLTALQLTACRLPPPSPLPIRALNRELVLPAFRPLN